MPASLEAFTHYFAYSLPIEKHNSMKETIYQNIRYALKWYLPGISTITSLAHLLTLPADVKHWAANERALTARSIICLVGLGILLLPIDLIGTALKAYTISNRIMAWQKDIPVFIQDAIEVMTIDQTKNQTDKQRYFVLQSLNHQIEQITTEIRPLASDLIEQSLQHVRECVQEPLSSLLTDFNFEIAWSERKNFSFCLLYHMQCARDLLGQPIVDQAQVSAYQHYIRDQIEAIEEGAMSAIIRYAIYHLIKSAKLSSDGQTLTINGENGLTMRLNLRSNFAHQFDQYIGQIKQIYSLLHASAFKNNLSEAGERYLIQRLTGMDIDESSLTLSNDQLKLAKSAYLLIGELHTLLEKGIINQYNTSEYDTYSVNFTEAFTF